MRKVIFIGAIFLVAISFAMKPECEIRSNALADSVYPKTLILLRHAKSDKSNMQMPDIMRPLEESGKKEAEEIGDFLAAQKIRIDKIFSSPSVRTKQTLEIICRKIGYGFEYVVWDSSLYACSGSHLIERIKTSSIDHRTVMFVGHNPSITDAANTLQDEQQISEVKTCGVVAIDYADMFNWTDMTKSKGALRFYRKPK